MGVEGSIDMAKQDTNATKFLELEQVKKALLGELHCLVGHCRFPTKGPVIFPQNNHPFNFGNSTIVHQGVLANDEVLKAKYQFNPEGLTDSWVIVHLIEHYRNEGLSTIDAIAAAHHELSGSWAVVLVDTLEPDKLYLFCHNKEIRVNYYPDEQVFMFSTDEKKLGKHGSQVENHLDYFEELKELRVAELTIKSEDCLVLGGEKEAEMWTLPAPPVEEYSWLNRGDKNEHHRNKHNRKKFGDGWTYDKDTKTHRMNPDKAEQLLLENRQGNSGRLPINKNISSKLIEVPEKGFVKVS